MPEWIAVDPLDVQISGVAALAGAAIPWESAEAWVRTLTDGLGRSPEPLLRDLAVLRDAMCDAGQMTCTFVGRWQVWLSVVAAHDSEPAVAQSILRLAGTGTLAACSLRMIEPHSLPIDP